MMNKQDKQRASAHGACGALAISLALAWGAMPRDAVAQTAPVQISITAQPLGDALIQLGEQASLVIFYLPETVRGRYAPAVSGRLTPDDALRRLLAGTQLTFQISGNSVTIVPAAAPGGVTTLSPISVTGRVESATGPVDGMVARRSATGTKSDVSVLETPQSLSIITPDQMDVQGATNLEQTVRYTPGIRSEILGAGTERDKIYIRGFEPNYYLDGMMLPYGAAGQGSRIEPYGLERIEVLRGPSSVLYGQNPPGGIINMVSKRPTAEPLREIALEGGNFDRRQVAADFSGPIDEEGKFLYRLTALKRNSDTQVDYARDDRDYVAPSFTWKPSAATSLTVLGQYQRDDADVSVMYLPAWGTLYKNPYGDIPRDRNVDEPDHDKFKRYYRSIGYLFEHHFNDKLTVRQNLRYADVDVTAYSVYGTGLIMNPVTQLPSDYRTLSRYQWDVDRYQSFFTLDNQAQAKFQTGALSHDLLLGLDYKRATLDQTVHGGVGPTIDIYNPVYRDIGRGAKVVDGYEEQHQIGLYLQDQVKLERWLLTMGGRYDWTDKTNRNRMTNVKTTSDDNVFTGRMGLTYLAESGLAPYASYSTSFEPVSGTGYGGTPFEPTKGRQYEVGVKYQPHNSNSLITVSAFHLTQENVLTPDIEHRNCALYPGTCGNFNEQTGEVEVKGLEFEGRASLTDSLNLITTYAYTTSEITRSNTATLGKQQPLIPRHQASAWADYTIGGGPLAGLRIGGGVRYVGTSYGDSTNTLKTPSYTLVDAALQYDLGMLSSQLKGARVSLNVNNLFDRRYLTTCAAVSACFYGPGRVVVAQVRYRW
ncbi:TonB-dependent siderophore receptor [Achromobacter veterisilvae]|uniref:TonB-dependent siderophore receptor n=1 Tax=Achromobacter veterisilvae TaxID=2069367 RepID=A0ABZ2S0Q9_9BURK